MDGPPMIRHNGPWWASTCGDVLKGDELVKVPIRDGRHDGWTLSHDGLQYM